MRFIVLHCSIMLLLAFSFTFDVKNVITIIILKIKNNMPKYFDIWTIIIILITVVLFFIALFVKGFTNQLLLEAGVLLVSIKIIMMSYKNIQNHEELKKDLDEIKKLLEEK